MKTLITVLLLAMMFFELSACGNSNTPSENRDTGDVTVSDVSQTAATGFQEGFIDMNSSDEE